MIIEAPQALRALAARLSACRSIALDVEGDGLYRYRARLCTMQLATAEDGPTVVDTLAIGAAAVREHLGALLGDDGPEKVVHDSAFDARILREHGIALGNVFDTSIAARFLGDVGTGLSTALSTYLGVSISKDLQQADWGVRPLDAEAITYLHDDVRHLPALADAMRARCEQADILDEVLEESRYMASARPDEDDEAPAPWLRVKGARELESGTSRAVLRAITALRERVAEREDVPAFRVLPSQLLVAIARRPPSSLEQLASISGMRKRAELVGAMWEAIDAARAEREVPEDELALLFPTPPPAPERNARKRREQALIELRREEAAKREVTTHVVLPGHCLREIVGRAPSTLDELRAIAGMGERRVERYGAAILERLGALT